MSSLVSTEEEAEVELFQFSGWKRQSAAGPIMASSEEVTKQKDGGKRVRSKNITLSPV